MPLRREALGQLDAQLWLRLGTAYTGEWHFKDNKNLVSLLGMPDWVVHKQRIYLMQSCFF